MACAIHAAWNERPVQLTPGDPAIIRLEQLYPLRRHDLTQILARYPKGTPVVWVQEEPKNMGAWTYVNRELPGLLSGAHPWSGVTRPLSASPATTDRSCVIQIRPSSVPAHKVLAVLNEGASA